jgi:hypothetical protein
MLRDDQVRRYARHVLVPDVGGVGQERLLAARVRIDARDPAGRAAAIYLAAAGLGTIVVDDAAVAAQNPDVRVLAAGDAPDLVIDDLPLPTCPGAGHADALVRGGAAACRLIHQLVS